MYPPQAPQPAPQAPPAAPIPPQDPPPLQMSSDDVQKWWARIELDRKRRKTESEKWNALFAGYMPPQDNTGAINSNIHFRNTHLKIAEVFAQMPDLKLTPLAPLRDIQGPPDQTGQPTQIAPSDIVSIKREVLKALLGRDHANVDLTILESLFSIFQTAGIGATKICYQADIQPIETQVPGPPIAQPGAILNLNPMPGPMITQTVPVPVHERWRWYHFSEEKLGIPHDWHSTDYDEAPYLFMEFVDRLTARTRKQYGLPDDFQANVSRDEMLIALQKDPGLGATDLIKGVEVWLRASEYDETVANTQLFYRLVLIEGLKDKAGVYERSPYQTVGPDGKLTHDSMIGNPIHPITLRVASDMAWVPADAAFTDPLVKQENTWMTQSVQARDANLPRFLHSDAITEAIDKLKNAEVGQGVAVAAELMTQIEKLIVPLPHLEHAQSDVATHTLIRRANDETLGLGSNQAGALNNTVRSATEVATVQANVSVRLKQEQNRLLARILQGVRKFDALVMRYHDREGYVEIVGQDGNRKLAAFTQAHLSGVYAYDAEIETQLSTDPERRLKKALDFQNFNAKNPFVDQMELTRLVASEYGYDTGRLIKAPQPPGPPHPNVSVKVDIVDLAGPAGGAALKVLQQAGYKLTDQDLRVAQANGLIVAQQKAEEQAAKTTHGGAADKADPLSKHHGELTGGMPGQVPQGAPPAQTPGMVS